MSISAHDIARVLSEALPYMQRYDEATVVVKYGGHAMGDEHMAREFARDIVLLEQAATNRITVLTQILGRELIPVLAPVAAAANGGTYNVNADTFAGAIAGALKAKRLLLLTDVPGVLDKSKNLIKELSADEARRLIADGTISGGMIPKVETCIDALEGGVEGAVILDGKVPHAVLLELFTELGAGTLFRR